MKVCVVTLGCKVNSYESEIIIEHFKDKNYEIVDKYINADIFVINTCTVTNTAGSKSKKIIRDVKRDNPKAILVVCGCLAQEKQENLNSLNIDILIGNKNKSKIVELVEDFLKSHKPYIKFEDMQKVEFEDMQVQKFSTHTRAFLKIQDGCNNYCSYCIIPYLRGALRCKKFAKAIEEAKILAEASHQEIVLTGIHTGTYQDDGYDLVDLINQMSKIPTLKRIRISSIEVLEITDKFLQMLKDNPKVCDHLHIPLQSGSNKILKLMNRRYTKEKYKQIIKKIRTIRPNISITTDLIVGFPFEDEELFEETYKFCQEMKFSKIHVFPFSSKNGTKAAGMSNHVPNIIKKQRVQKILKLSKELEEEYYQKFYHQEVEVLIEKASDDYSTGHTSNYINIKILKKLKPNTFYKLVIDKVCQSNVHAHLIDCKIKN